MSGGSFDYLHIKGADEILGSIGTVRRMAEWLRENGKTDAAAEIERLFLDLRTFEQMIAVRLSRLTNVIHAAEWWCSCDWGPDEFDREWSKFLLGETNSRRCACKCGKPGCNGGKA